MVLKRRRNRQTDRQTNAERRREKGRGRTFESRVNCKQSKKISGAKSLRNVKRNESDRRAEQRALSLSGTGNGKRNPDSITNIQDRCRKL